MRIDCFKYEYPVGTDNSDKNFFSSVVPDELDIIDLFEFYIDGTMSKIEWKFTEIDETDNTMYVKASGFSMDVIADNHSGDDLYEFFEMYSNSDSYKWKVIMYDDDDTPIYYGMIYKDGLESSERESGIISVKVIGYEKEFSRFYSNETLIGTEFLPNTTLPVDLSFLTGLNVYRLSDVLKANFPNVVFGFQFDLTHFIGKFYVVDKPYFYSPSIRFNTGTVNIRAGYDSFVLMNADRFKWLDGICQCYGWKWFFFNNRLYIENLSDNVFPEYEIDANESIISHGLSTSSQQYQTDHVIIEDGGYYSNQPEEDFVRTLQISSTTDGVLYLGGSRRAIYSNTNDYFKNHQPFGYLIFSEFIGGGGSYLYHFDGDFTVFTVEDWDDTYRLKKLEMYSAPFMQYETTDRFLNYRKKNSIVLNPIVCNEQYGGTLNLNYARQTGGAFYGNGNAYRINHDVGNDGFYYTGSVGHNLIYYDATRSPAGYLTFEHYQGTEQWKANMRCHTSVINQNIIEVDGFDTINTPLVTPKLINYDYGNLNDVMFSVTRFAFHPIDKTFEMTIVR